MSGMDEQPVRMIPVPTKGSIPLYWLGIGSEDETLCWLQQSEEEFSKDFIVDTKQHGWSMEDFDRIVRVCSVFPYDNGPFDADFVKEVIDEMRRMFKRRGYVFNSEIWNRYR